MSSDPAVFRDPRFDRERRSVNFDKDYPDGDRSTMYRQYEMSQPRYGNVTDFPVPENDEWARDRFQPSQHSRINDRTSQVDPGKTEKLKYAIGFGVGLTSVIAENVLSHPFIVLRRQCQLHYDSLSRYHLTPFTLVQPMCNIGREGVGGMWKGCISSLMVQGMSVATETVFSEVTQLPKEVGRNRTLKKIAEHLLLKGLTVIVLTPFLASSMIESVQSEMASERPGTFDWLREGATRLMFINTPQMTRLLPVWKLVLPTLVYGLSHYIISSLAKHLTLLSVRTEHDRPSRARRSVEPPPPTPGQGHVESFYPELLATFTGKLLADMLLYPLETVLHRLQAQGTRTIIDNLDTGVGVVPIITRYDGVVDCCHSIIRDEGLLALYKGFGALVMQYAMHAALLKMTRLAFEMLQSRANGAPPPLTADGLSYADITSDPRTDRHDDLRFLDVQRRK